MKRYFVFGVLLTVLLLVLCGCNNGKKFESTEAMLEEMAGTYAGTGEHSGERIVISPDGIIKFNIDNIFPEISDSNFFAKNFSQEDWGNFDLDALLDKSYTSVTTEPFSADIRKSSISGLWIDRDGILHSQKKDGFPLEKVSSSTDYPTEEMIDAFESYKSYLQEFEISSIITEANSDLEDKQNTLESALLDARGSTSVRYTCPATPEEIAKAAFDSLLKDGFKYPYTAKLEGYSTEPMKDDYGRVCTMIVCSAKNGLGNSLTESYYVVLQSCWSADTYDYIPGGVHFTTNSELAEYVLSFNRFDVDPNYNSKMDEPYNVAIRLIEDGNYESAITELEKLDGYRSSAQLIDACQAYLSAKTYKEAVDLFGNKQYGAAAEKLASSQYLQAERIRFLCSIWGEIETTPDDTENGEGGDQNPPDIPSSEPDGGSSVLCPNGHTPLPATCTEAGKCAVCGMVCGDPPLGHSLFLTKCTRCGVSDFSAVARSYDDAQVIANDMVTNGAYSVTNVVLSASGEFSFDLNGKHYCLTVVQRDEECDSMGFVSFDCYVNGELNPDATFAMYADPNHMMPRLQWKNLDGCDLFLFVDLFF